ncbi:MAG TPA: bifunctional precorrin-2 dehydrogenase/sirohydrochlorin ferrochelatase [Phycisphaerae bacterium]|nr:bifunctional precorrin-2 dehydrogenase/sirohydrochlorin ferrochelatase [Phycisphaerae bacterium]
MPAPTPYPLFLSLARRDVLIVGGGVVAVRKAQGLLDAGARVTIVSPAFNDAFHKLKPIKCVRARYTSAHMRRKNWCLVFAATDVPSVNQRVQKDAAGNNILCCRCDNPDRGDFANGATASVGSVVISVSTQGASPGLAARIREQAANGIDPLLARLAELHRAWRPLIRKSIHTIEHRRIILQRLAGEEMIARLRRQGAKGAQKLLRQYLAELTSPTKKTPSSKRDPQRGRRSRA